MSLTLAYHEDLLRIARTLDAKNHGMRQADPCVPRLSLSINDAAGTVSDRNTGELLGYVSRDFTAMSAEEFLGWHEWPVSIKP